MRFVVKTLLNTARGPCRATGANDARSRRLLPCRPFRCIVSTAYCWQRRHTDLTSRLIAIETELDDRVNRLFNLSAPDLRRLADHTSKAMINYPYGAV